jgi:hypothetical protein
MNKGGIKEYRRLEEGYHKVVAEIGKGGVSRDKY